MKSLQNKIMYLSLLCVIVSIITSTLIGVVVIRQVLNNDNREILTLTGEKNAIQLNNVLDDMQRAVSAVNYYTTSSIEQRPNILEDRAKYEQFLSQVTVVAKNEAENTEGVMAVYMRLLPEYYGYQTGFFLTNLHEGNEFKASAITDFSIYDRNDTEHVGWFYPVIDAAEPIWIEPYYNANVDVEMISYVTPIMYEGRAIGVVGMDIDMDEIQSIVQKIKVLDNGRGFLVDKAGVPIFKSNIVDGRDMSVFNKQISRILGPYDKAEESGIHTYHWGDKKWYLITRKLMNGMRIAITVADEEVRAPERRMFSIMMVAIAVLLVLSFVMTKATTRMIIRPIWQLTHAANKIAKGDLDVKLDYAGNDEIGLLTKCFKDTTQELKRYMDTMNELAYHDALTGALNKTAYEERITEIDRSIKDNVASFAVVVFDVNNLKTVNDTFGHEIGDKLILDAVKTMHKTFGTQNVYRIGGDEFAALLTGSQLFTCKELLNVFDEEVARTNQQEWGEYEVEFQVARGLMVYAQGDETYAEVFRKADQNMYEHKRYLKGLKKEQ